MKECDTTIFAVIFRMVIKSSKYEIDSFII
jgi:hypothetical protein